MKTDKLHSHLPAFGKVTGCTSLTDCRKVAAAIVEAISDGAIREPIWDSEWDALIYDACYELEVDSRKTPRCLVSNLVSEALENEELD